jgi:arsenate reductase
MTAHWGIPDPAAVQGPDAQKRKAFEEAYLTLERRILLFVSLPIRSLDRLTLARKVADIGKA